MPEPDRELLVAAAWMHDIGYADQVKSTWFHPIDRGRDLRTGGFDDRLTALVAHHSGVRFVAQVRDLADEVGEFAFEALPVADALTYADQTVGPGGRSIQLRERIADVLDRTARTRPTPRRVRSRPVPVSGRNQGAGPASVTGHRRQFRHTPVGSGRDS